MVPEAIAAPTRNCRKKINKPSYLCISQSGIQFENVGSYLFNSIIKIAFALIGCIICAWHTYMLLNVYVNWNIQTFVDAQTCSFYICNSGVLIWTWTTHNACKFTYAKPHFLRVSASFEIWNVFFFVRQYFELTLCVHAASFLLNYTNKPDHISHQWHLNRCLQYFWSYYVNIFCIFYIL